ncbi:hypothetical protein HI914_05326 [Erysiphe necator]|nr:hypothetical protein HI914_05326 [Erysiphe necator]
MIRRTLSSRSEQVSNDFPSPEHLPVRSLDRNLDIVAHGTVASRVHQLQGLSSKFSPESRSNERNDNRESSYTKFGRRITKRFSQPAQRNSKPSEETQYETTHSYNGINTSYISDDQNLGIINARTKPDLCDKKAQVGTLVPTLKIKYDKPSSWKDTFKVASRSLGVACASPDINSSQEKANSINNQVISEIYAPTLLSDFPNDHLKSLKHKEELKIQKRGSDSSISTTSSMRRRSVRELFAHHGIKTPPGLASSVKTSNTVDSNNLETHYYCHRCSFINKKNAAVCYNCENLLKSHNDLRENQNSIARPNRELESNDPDIHKKQFLELDSTSFIRKSQRSRPSPFQPNEMLPNKDLKSDKSKTLSREFSQRVNTYKSTRENSREKKDWETANPVPFLSGRNVTTSVKQSPFFARDSLEVSSLGQSRPRVASKKFSCDTLQLDSTASQNREYGHMPLRHCISLSKTQQNQYQVDSKNERQMGDIFLEKGIKLNPQYKALTINPTNLKTAVNIQSKKSLDTQNKKTAEKICVEIDDESHSLDANIFLKNVEKNYPTATHKKYSKGDFQPDTKDFPFADGYTEKFGVPPRENSVLFRSAARLNKAGSISKSNTEILNLSGRQHAFPSRDIDLEATNKPELGNFLRREKAIDFPSKPDSKLSKVNSLLSPQEEASVTSEIDAKSDNERKKLRRIKIAKKIKLNLPQITDQTVNNLERKIRENLSEDNSHLTGMAISSELSKKINTDRWMELPPINPGDYRSHWERNADTSLTDITTQEIRGVTVTLQLEGRDDMVFKAKPSKTGVEK